MKFQIAVIDDLSNPNQPAAANTDAEMAAVTAFNNQLRANGQLLFAEGIEPPANAIVFDNRGGANLESAGALFGSGENISGLWIIEANDTADAQALAKQASLACNRKVELRKFY